MDTLIETVRLRNGAAPLWYLHVRRLATSCRALGVPIPVELPTPEGGADRVHRLLVSRRGVVAGERPVGSTAPVRLITSKVVHRPYPHKLVDRERFDRTLADAKAVGADDGLLLTVGGQVAETAIWGVFWWEDGRVAAPALDIGILPGVARARIGEMVGRDRRAEGHAGGDPGQIAVRRELGARGGAGGHARRCGGAGFAGNRGARESLLALTQAHRTR